jgi:hypothetical protein
MMSLEPEVSPFARRARRRQTGTYPQLHRSPRRARPRDRDAGTLCPPHTHTTIKMEQTYIVSARRGSRAARRRRWATRKSRARPANDAESPRGPAAGAGHPATAAPTPTDGGLRVALEFCAGGRAHASAQRCGRSAATLRRARARGQEVSARTDSRRTPQGAALAGGLLCGRRGALASRGVRARLRTRGRARPAVGHNALLPRGLPHQRRGVAPHSCRRRKHAPSSVAVHYSAWAPRVLPPRPCCASPSRRGRGLAHPSPHRRRPCPALARAPLSSLCEEMAKPDSVQRGLVGEIIKRFEAKGAWRRRSVGGVRK